MEECSKKGIEGCYNKYTAKLGIGWLVGVIEGEEARNTIKIATDWLNCVSKTNERWF